MGSRGDTCYGARTAERIHAKPKAQGAPAVSGTTATSGNAKAEDSCRMRSGQRDRSKAGAAIEAAWQAEVELV